MQFKDHFSRHAANYAAARPHYPAELFAFLAAQCQERCLAWDCATGNGQAAVALAEHFERVVATDASQAQLDAATRHSGVEYSRYAAEEIPLAPSSTDLVAVAQALHWFDIDKFFDNAATVLKPGGILAVWSYGLTTISPQIDRIVQFLYKDILGDYWPEERRLVEAGYGAVVFPFAPIDAPAMLMRCEWSLQQLQGYLLSWSASRRFIDAEQSDPLEMVRAELAHAWGDAQVQSVQWPLQLHVRRK